MRGQDFPSYAYFGQTPNPLILHPSVQHLLLKNDHEVSVNDVGMSGDLGLRHTANTLVTLFYDKYHCCHCY